MEAIKNDLMKWTLGLVAAVLALLIIIEVRTVPAPVPSADALERQIIIHGKSGYVPNSAGWVADATQLLRARPELSGRIGRLAESAEVNGVARGLVLDALARAGGEPAQAAMRHALETSTVQDDPAYPLLVARLGQVALPAAETMAFLEETRERAALVADRDLRLASTSALNEAYAHRLAWLHVGRVGSAAIH